MKKIQDLLGDIIPEKKAPETEATGASKHTDDSTSTAEIVKPAPLEGHALTIGLHLVKYGRISVQESMKILDIRQSTLACRIGDLRARGWEINTDKKLQDIGLKTPQEAPVYVLLAVGLIDADIMKVLGAM